MLLCRRADEVVATDADDVPSRVREITGACLAPTIQFLHADELYPEKLLQSGKSVLLHLLDFSSMDTSRYAGEVLALRHHRGSFSCCLLPPTTPRANTATLPM